MSAASLANYKPFFLKTYSYVCLQQPQNTSLPVEKVSVEDTLIKNI